MSVRLSARFLGQLLLLPSRLRPQKEISACTLVGSLAALAAPLFPTVVSSLAEIFWPTAEKGCWPQLLSMATRRKSKPLGACDKGEGK